MPTENGILDDGNSVATKTSLMLCCSSCGRMVSVFLISFEKDELQMKKNQTFFLIPFFAQKTKNEIKIMTLFLG